MQSYLPWYAITIECSRKDYRTPTANTLLALIHIRSARSGRRRPCTRPSHPLPTVAQLAQKTSIPATQLFLSLAKILHPVPLSRSITGHIADNRVLGRRELFLRPLPRTHTSRDHLQNNINGPQVITITKHSQICKRIPSHLPTLREAAFPLKPAGETQLMSHCTSLLNPP